MGRGIGKIADACRRAGNRLEETLVVLLLAIMIVLACLQIGLRVFFSSGLLWADPLLRVMVLWVGLLGAAVATRRERHISIDIVSHFLPARFLPPVRAGIDLFSAAVCGVLAYAAAIFVRDEARYGGIVAAGIPSWLANLVFPLVFSLVTVRFLARAVTGMRGIIAGGGEGTPGSDRQ